MVNHIFLKFLYNTKHQLHFWRTGIIWRKGVSCLAWNCYCLRQHPTSDFFSKIFSKLLFVEMKLFFVHLIANSIYLYITLNFLRCLFIIWFFILYSYLTKFEKCLHLINRSKTRTNTLCLICVTFRTSLFFF